MKNQMKFTAGWSGIFVLFWASHVSAQTVHEVQVLDNIFNPPTLNIEVGDTVRWVNPVNGGMGHDVVSADGLWTPPAIAESWTFEFTFENEGSFGYWCTPHRAIGMTGTINVSDPNSGGSGVDLNPGHNGNWWNGIERNGEGLQLEVADDGDGGQLFVATMYSYDPAGDQIFLVAIGTTDGETVDVQVIISEGGVWGDDYDAANVTQPVWGTGTFTSGGCDQLSMTLTPNAEYQGLGFTELSYDLERLTNAIVPCPFDAGN